MLGLTETALQMLEEVTDKKQVDVLWIAAITSLRAVGHVLRKKDCNETPDLKPIVDNWWSILHENKNAQKNKIFFEFIEKERNLSIKENSFNYDKELQDILIVEDDNNDIFFLKDLIDYFIFIPINDGMYEGQDIREVIEEAIIWWKEQLSYIEKEYIKMCY